MIDNKELLTKHRKMVRKNFMISENYIEELGSIAKETPYSVSDLVRHGIGLIIAEYKNVLRKKE